MIKWGTKDGGPNSPVTFYGIEIKSLFSIGILRFNKGTREEYHTHAFDAYTWFLAGSMKEDELDIEEGKLSCTHTWYTWYTHNIKPKFTPRDKLHRVIAYCTSWCFTIRGPWRDYWMEYNKKTDKTTLFTHGRKVIECL